MNNLAQGKTVGNIMLKYATYYMKNLGFSVIPVNPRDKKPLIPWEEYQSRKATAEEITQWWQKWPNANIGIITGAVSGIIVLDVDGEEGQRSIKDNKLSLPPAWAARTGGGGFHYFFKHPGNSVCNFVKRLPGIDLRGDGGYIVAPPSIHPSGNRYQWVISPKDEELAEPPDWLLELIQTTSTGRLEPEDWQRDIPEGQRNEELTRRAGSLLAKGIPAAEVLTMLLAWNEKHCKPPLPEKEVRTIVASIAKREMEKKNEHKAEDEEQEEQKRESTANKLIRLALAEAFLFHDELQDGYASIPINNHREIWPIKSKFFKQWLRRRYYELTKKSPNSEAMRQALDLIEAKAVFDGQQVKLNLRVAKHDNAFWYDLANEKWQAVKITTDGWEVVDNPPILFKRYKNTAAQVLPQRGRSLDLLKKYINLKDEADWQLLIPLIIHAFIPDIPHAIPIFYGDKGAAKTTAQRVIRKLIDPAHRDTMTLPSDKNELALMLMTNYAPSFDNLDGLSPWQSDMLCQAATGGGISKRELYTDMEEVILSFLRCPMLNGINLVASRDDLLDRSVLFRLERINEKERKTEAEFWREFERDRPYILGAIFDVLSKALQIYPKVKLPALPRMADFTMWGYAISEAIEPGRGEKFLQAYRKNIAGAVEEAVIGDVVGAAVVEFMGGKDEWQGTATELLKALNELPSVNDKDKAWPKRPHTLTRRLNKIKSALADYGIKVGADNRTANQRLILLQKEETSINDAFMTLHDAFTSKASLSEPLGDKAYDANDANDAFFGKFKKGYLEVENSHQDEGESDLKPVETFLKDGKEWGVWEI